ncbi:uncharacterized protein E5676_scaffold3009G00020 [Cucumis melo var. makuwa]|uniref:SWIM-type domain-containing protein n=1 Tax=Cucumis melo var. makuwa TaxID=1194695 RepID=A0A5D3DFS5_CUCMM|nr:uncharacterized protein E5676_scaffold3009G00020 [Cucumis melo var. makuwa]
MIKLPIVVFHSGQWDDTNSYLNYKTTGVLVDEIMCFENFVSLILRGVRFDASPSSIQLSILLDYGITDIQTVVQIQEDKDVTWFLSLVKGQITRHPLVAHAIAHVPDMDLEWSSVVDSGMDNLCSLLPSSSINDDFQILTDIHVSSLSFTFDLKEKDMFASKKLLSKSFYYIAIKNNFEFKTVKSNSKSIEFKCSQDNCSWYVRASRYKGGELWRLRKYIANHNCSINVIQTTHKQASASLISDCIGKDFSSFDRSTPNDIMIHMRTKLGVNVSYYKAWRAKELVMNSLNGEAKESYALIPNFFMKLKEINPGSFTAYETDTEGHFKYCFMAIGACIEGWKYCRPNISVDVVDFETNMRWMESMYPSIRDYLSKVNAINDVEFQVIDGRKQFIVRLDCKSCTCRVWDLDEIPCAHALAVLRGLRPVGNHANWKSIGIENNILPPTFKRRAGRPRKQRILSIGEKKSHSRCSHCHRAGHNRRNCKFPPFLQ